MHTSCIPLLLLRFAPLLSPTLSCTSDLRAGGTGIPRNREMAGQADKKRQQKAASYFQTHMLGVGISTALFLCFRALLFKNNFPSSFVSSFPFLGWWEGSWLAATYALYYSTYSSITSSLLLGVPHSLATDFFLVAAASQIAGGVHPNGWLLWMVVPAYAIYKVVRHILDWVFTPDEPPEDSPAAAALRKKEEKLQRKIRSGRVAVIR